MTMPEGHKLFNDKDILAAVHNKPVTAMEIMREFNKDLPPELCITYNTMRKYLDELWEKKKVERGKGALNNRVYYWRKEIKLKRHKGR